MVRVGLALVFVASPRIMGAADLATARGVGTTRVALLCYPGVLFSLFMSSSITECSAYSQSSFLRVGDQCARTFLAGGRSIMFNTSAVVSPDHTPSGHLGRADFVFRNPQNAMSDVIVQRGNLFNLLMSGESYTYR